MYFEHPKQFVRKSGYLLYYRRKKLKPAKINPFDKYYSIYSDCHAKKGLT